MIFNGSSFSSFENFAYLIMRRSLRKEIKMEEKIAWYYALLLGGFLIIGFLPFRKVLYIALVIGIVIDFIRFLIKERS